MDVLLSLLGANLKLHDHTASALEKATARPPVPKGKMLAWNEQAFNRAELALREAEMRELALLHQTALLIQALKRDETQRRKEQKPPRIVLTEPALQAQDKAPKGPQSGIEKSVGEFITIFLAQHEALARAAALLQAFDSRLDLLQPDANAAILNTFAAAENSAQRLREMALAEAQGDQPRKLAAALEARRGKLRQQMTRLSSARRHFTAFVYQHIPAGAAL